MQITLFRDDEHTVGLDDKSFRDQFNRHLCVARENLVELELQLTRQEKKDIVAFMMQL
jgi:cytochrome c1